VPDRAASNEWAARLSLVAECGIDLSRHSRPHAVESAKTDGDSDSEPLSIERSREVLGAEAETKRSKRCALEPTRGTLTHQHLSQSTTARTSSRVATDKAAVRSRFGSRIDLV